jgi:hypothetical protein
MAASAAATKATAKAKPSTPVKTNGPALMKVAVPPERFADSNQKTSVAARGKNNVRRPTSGITLRDETFASIRLVSGDGVNQRIIDAGSRLPNPDKSGEPLTVKVGDKTYVANEVYSNFLLQNIAEERSEKVQVLETFGEPYIFLFGERPRVLNCQGILLNTWDFNWEAEWWANYDNFLRGTKCVENDARVYMAFDNTLVGGYILSSSATKVAQERHFVQFQFQLFVTYYESFSNLGDPSVSPFGDLAYSGNDAAAITAVGGPKYPIDGIFEGGQRISVDAAGNVTGTDNYKQAVKDAQPSTLAQSWRNIQQATRSVLSTVSQVWEGEVIKVPDGFSGMFAFDEQVQVKERKDLTSQTIRYTTFSENDSEYVGTSSHYGSADLRFNGLGGGFVQDFTEANRASAQAAKFFKDNGITPGPSVAENLGKLVKQARAGLVAVNAATAIAGFARHGIQPATPDLSGSVFNWSNNYGGAMKRSTSNSYPE